MHQVVQFPLACSQSFPEPLVLGLKPLHVQDIELGHPGIGFVVEVSGDRQVRLDLGAVSRGHHSSSPSYSAKKRFSKSSSPQLVRCHNHSENCFTVALVGSLKVAA